MLVLLLLRFTCRVHALLAIQAVVASHLEELGAVGRLQEHVRKPARAQSSASNAAGGGGIH